MASEREHRRGGEGAVRVGREPTSAPSRGATLYDDVLELLMSRGWVRGRGERGLRVSLPAAIDLVARASVSSAEPTAGAVLARAARARRHLCELARASSLTAWNDEPGRTLADVRDLLEAARVAFRDD